MRCLKGLFLIFSLTSCAYVTTADSANTNNSLVHRGEPILDVTNKPVDAHAGDIVEYKGTYYWFGENRRKANQNPGVQVYESKDLLSWTNKGVALAQVGDPSSEIQYGSIIERPKVIYNDKNQDFVMWFHLEHKGDGYKDALVGIARSKSITGPYKFIKSFRINAEKLPMNTLSMQHVPNGKFFQRDFANGQMSRDMTIFKDTDGRAYLVSSSEENSSLTISLLNDSYDGLTGEFVRVAPNGYNEAPVMFKKGQRYFLITSGTSGWKPNKARLFYSDSILGDWHGAKAPIQSNNPNDVNTTFKSQGAFVFNYQGQYIFVADRWDTSNIMNSKYVWIPIRWDANGMPYLNLN
ncbi:glycoside hydrolase family 43 protein [Rouxiella badensis]|uniref:glycoside hydrolase family 43 protein n=1 Tax=Rouxiella badensis TaxID=1646377 RepID=UPI0013EEF45F|nr:glycoside hydrolase family 43 protein [Rouxiella badensis]MCC3733301.1 glycoside hydrolase family 43 protein [Rouxiella badensis]MCC3758048.1 glycoside hydrolase family 43 protein [Rouxiella badensis]QII36381.1 family 43 glycosylhydrolase [Rouxiella badensis]WAT08725.1 glycoside hydrolase family 43 protein [Rouxiella badensis]